MRDNAKHCPSCLLWKPLEEFPGSRGNGYRRLCRVCAAEHRKEYMRQRWHSPIGSELRAKILLRKARVQAQRNGFEFDLDIEWVAERLAAGVCEATGIRFSDDDKGSARCAPWAPSVDRLNPGGPYEKWNCRIVVWVFNLAKNDYDESIVARLAEAICHRHESNSRTQSSNSG